MIQRGREAPSSLSVLLFQSKGLHFLLPNAAVGEVIAYHPPEPLRKDVPWLLGNLDWREQLVPAISLSSAATGQPVKGIPKQACFAICFSPNGNLDLPYFAILADAVPRLMNLEPSSMQSAPAPAKRNPFALHYLTDGTQIIMIPNLDAVEQALLSVQ